MNTSFIIFIPIIILIFWLCREVVTWYWKLNKISDLLEKIEENTRQKNQTKSDKEIPK